MITTATASSAAGAYPITASGAVDPNYSISYTPGNLTVAPAELTITPDEQSKSYGAVLPVLTVSYSGLVNGDTAASLTTPPAVITTATATSAAGAYPITASGAVDPNYSISYTPGNFTVTSAGLTITPNDQSKLYGAVLPALTVSYSGLVNGDTAASLTTPPAVITTATATSAAGAYPITASGAVGPNYSISYTPGRLRVIPAPLAVTGNNQTKTVGTPDPPFTVTYVGFVGDETELVLGGTLSLARAPGETVGTYLIAPSGLTSSNYSITFSTGTLTIIAPAAPTNLAITSTGSSSLLLSWAAFSNITYRVQFKSGLDANTWSDLPGDVTATSAVASKIELTTPTNRFYRLKVLP